MICSRPRANRQGVWRMSISRDQICPNLRTHAPFGKHFAIYFNVKYSVYFFTIRKWIRRISKGYAWWLSGYERDSGVVGSDFVSPLSWCDTCLQDRPLVVFSGYPQFPLRCVCVFPHRHRVQRCHVATPTTAHTPDDTVIQRTVVLAGEEHHPDVTSSFWLRCFGVPGKFCHSILHWERPSRQTSAPQRQPKSWLFSPLSLTSAVLMISCLHLALLPQGSCPSPESLSSWLKSQSRREIPWR